ncbi:TNF receptor-associated factor 3-like [Ptychodera flava]|uniref:TNF receptor-associated factor 3-like n=1 Tax=Ptychodera flava TaxID=63121 RepID=UPI003969E885
MENTIEICRSELLKIFEDLGQGDREKAKHLMRAMRIPWGSLERLSSSSDFANIFMNHSDSVDVCKERVKFILNKIPRRDITLQNADFFTKTHIQKSEDKKQKCVPDERDSSPCYSGSCDQTIQRLSRQVKELETKIDSLTSASNSPSDRVHNFQSRSTLEEVQSGEWQNSKVDNNYKVTSSLQELKQRQSIFETTISTYREMVDLLKNQVNCYSTTMNNLQLERLHDKERLDSMERKLKHLENVTALNDVSLAEQRHSISLLESVSYDGVLLWKITDFSKRREDANNDRLLSIYSPFFFCVFLFKSSWI